MIAVMLSATASEIKKTTPDLQGASDENENKKGIRKK